MTEPLGWIEGVVERLKSLSCPEGKEGIAMIALPYVSMITGHLSNRYDWDFQKFASRRMLEAMSFRLSLKLSNTKRPTRTDYMSKAMLEILELTFP